MLNFLLVFALCTAVSLHTNLTGVVQRCALIHTLNVIVLALWQSSQFYIGIAAVDADWLSLAAVNLCSCAASIILLICIRLFRSFRFSPNDCR